MSSQKTIVVFGATGTQGGAVIRAILADPEGEFCVRAVTRNLDSEKASELAKLDGVDVVACDANDVDQVKAALGDAYGALFVTNPFDPTSCATPDVEAKQAANFAEASEAAGLEHAIWSTTENPLDDVPLESDALPTLMRKNRDGEMKGYKVPHFENKAICDKGFEEGPVPTTFILPGFFYENFLTYFPLKREEGGKLQFCVPTGNAKIPMTGADDIGNVAHAIFKGGPEEYAGKRIGIAAEHLTMDEAAETFGDVLGEPVENNRFVTAEIFSTFGFPGCEELANMFIYERDFNAQYCGRRSVDETKKVYEDLTSFEKYVQENKGKFVEMCS